MLLLLLILFPLTVQSIASTDKELRTKRDQNGYGDETVTPEGVEEEGYEPLSEETALPVDNGGYETDQPDVYPAGYRRKREENSYGDELVTPSGTLEEYQSATEETPAPVENIPYGEEKTPPVEAAGY